MKHNTIKALIFDMDGTLYNIDDRVVYEWNLAVAKAAVANGVPLDIDGAIAAAEEGWNNHYFSGHVFVNDYGLRRESVMPVHHFNTSFFEICPDTLSEMKKCSAELYVFTESKRDWTNRILSAHGYNIHFSDNRIFTCDEVNNIKKSAGTETFETVLDAIGLKPNQTMMIEDSTKNTAMAKKAGMNTTLITYGKEITSPDADYTFNKPLDFLRAFNTGLII